MNEIVVQRDDFTVEQVNLIKATVAKGATDAELKLFLHRCKNMDLDPLKPGQIHFVKYGTSPGTIIIGIDGFRSRAAKTGKHTGTQRGVLRDENGKLVGGWAKIYREGWVQPAHEEVSLSEYDTNKAQWAKMKETMIKKVAEVVALRVAFPDELGGLYSDDEMGQATSHIEAREVSTEPVAARKHNLSPIISEAEADPGGRVRMMAAIDSGDPDEIDRALGPDPGDVVCNFGTKYKGQKVRDIPAVGLAGYVSFIESGLRKDNRDAKGDVKDFLMAAKDWLENYNGKA